MLLEELLTKGFADMGLDCTGDAVQKLRIYYEYLEEINQVMNLTAISGEQDVAQLHFLDCAALLKLYDFSGKSVIDVGTGAGFPGLVLKTLKDDMRLTLLDSLDKRVNFLKNTCDKLMLSDVECIHARAEEIPDGRWEAYDIAVSRAVARLNILCELCLPYVKKGGVFIAMKGPELRNELEEAKRAITALGGKAEQCFDYTIPGTDITHSALIIRKAAETPKKYPRRWAQIKKTPL